MSEMASDAQRRLGQSLLVQVLAVNAAVLALGTLVLAVSPLTVSWPVALAEAIVLFVGLILLTAFNFVLLRRAFAPLRRLAAFMRRVDLVRGGERVPAYGDHEEVVQLTEAFNEMLDRLAAERRRSVRAALGAQEAERRRVAQELHDEIGQSLTAISLRLEAAAREPGGAAAGDLRAVQAIAADSVGQVREIARRLRPELLDDLGLVSALVALAERVSDGGGVTVERALERDLPEHGAEVDLVIYRVAQESLTNVIRHADAKRVRLALARERDWIVLTVDDDGRGMASGEPGTGIQGMRERAVLIRADLDIGSSALGGVRVRLAVPPESLGGAG